VVNTNIRRIRKLTKEQRETIPLLYLEDKLSIKDIAKELDVNYAIVRYHLLACDIKLRSPEEGRKLFEEKNPDFWTGENNPAFKGKRKYADYIMVYCPNHPRARRRSSLKGYVQEHILIWEQASTKSLPEDWLVHHINGIKSDNRLSNLVALPSKKHRLLIPELQKRIQELEAKLKAQDQLC